jgi:plastocyanin
MRMGTTRALALVAAAMMLGAACGKSGGGATSGSSAGTTTSPSAEASASPSESASGGSLTIDGEKANDHGTKAVSGSSFELEADNDGNEFYFDPTILQGAPGQQVKIEIKNEGSVKHNFTIEDQKIDEDLDPGKTVEVTVTFPQSGQVEFHCEYHRSLGMVGALEATS